MAKKYKENWAAGFDVSRPEEMVRLMMNETVESLEGGGFAVIVASIPNVGEDVTPIVLWSEEPELQPRVRKLAEAVRERILPAAAE